MVKKSEINKKGRLAKSTLSVVLAASMVLTSSSFVWAAPVEDIAIVEEGDTAVEASVEDTVGTSIGEVSNAGTEENVGAAQTVKDLVLKTKSFIYTSDAITKTDVWNAFNAVTVDDGVTPSGISLSLFIADTTNYEVTIENLSDHTITPIKTVNSDIPVAIGNYRLKVEGISDIRTGSTFADYSIVADVTSTVIDSIQAIPYTGNPVFPDVKTLTLCSDPANHPAHTSGSGYDITLYEGTDYDVIDYQKNTDVCEDGKGAYVQIQFKDKYEARGTENVYFAITATALSANNTRVTVTDSVYNGKEQTPEVKVEYKKDVNTNYVVIDPANYTVKVTSGKKALNAGTYSLTIDFKGNYSGSANEKFVIKQQEFNSSTVTIETPVVPFEGETADGYKAEVIIKDATTGEIVYNSKNDTPSDGINVLYVDSNGKYSANGWQNNKKEDSYGIKIVSDGSGNYKANTTGITKSYTVGYVAPSLQKYLKDNAPVLESVELPYDKDGVVPGYVTINKTTYNADGTKSALSCAEAGWFDVVFPSVSETKKVGTYEIKLVGKGEWSGQTATISYKVIPKKLTSFLSNVTVSQTSTGALTAAIKIIDDDYRLVNGEDFTYTITKETAGTYAVAVSLKGNYEGTDKASNKALSNGLDLNSDVIKATVTGEYIYNGKVIKPADENIVITEVNTGKSIELRQDIDYTITGYGRNIDVGEGIVKVAGKGSYTGDLDVKFAIKAGDTVKDNYVLDTANLKAVYDADTTFDPAGDIKVKTTAGKQLVENADYTIKYLRDGKEISAVQAKGLGSVTMEITIKTTQTKLTAAYRVARSLEKAADIQEKIADMDYTGKMVEPAVKVTRKNSAVELKKDVDYVVSYENNIDVGTGYAIVEGIGNYYGTYVRKFNIVGQMEQDIVVLPAQVRDLQKRTLKSKATVVKYTVAPKTEVSYASSNPAVVKVDAKTGAIEYTGIGTAKITISVAESEIYKAATKELTVKVLPATPANVKVTTAKKKITVKAGRVPEATKYQIRIQKLGCKSTYVNVANKGDLNKVYTTKSAGKFNVWVRAYKTVEGVHHFSAWSAVKTVTVK